MGFEIECLMLKSNKSNKLDGELKESEHYCYICVKKHDADKLVAENWPRVMEEILKEQSEENYDDNEEEDDEAD